MEVHTPWLVIVHTPRNPYVRTIFVVEGAKLVLNMQKGQGSCGTMLVTTSQNPGQTASPIHLG